MLSQGPWTSPSTEGGPSTLGSEGRGRKCLRTDGQTHSASQDFTHSPPTTGDKMMWFSLHSCKQGPSYSVVKKKKEKTTIFSFSGEEGMIFSLCSRQEEKVIWFPGESWGLGQQPLCWRGSKRGSSQVGQEQLHAILGCPHQAGEKWVK